MKIASVPIEGDQSELFLTQLRLKDLDIYSGIILQTSIGTCSWLAFCFMVISLLLLFSQLKKQVNQKLFVFF